MMGKESYSLTATTTYNYKPKCWINIDDVEPKSPLFLELLSQLSFFKVYIIIRLST